MSLVKLGLGILGGTLLFALSGPLALAQEPDPGAAEPVAEVPAAPQPGSERAAAGAAEPKPAQMTLRVKGADGREVRVGRKIKAVGRIAPFVPRQVVRVWLTDGGKKVKHTVPIRRVDRRNFGRYEWESKRLIEPGRFTVRAHKVATDEQAGNDRESKKLHVAYPNLDMGDRSDTVGLFNKLLKRKAYYTGGGDKYADATGRAVLAFRKVNGMKRTMNATPGIFRTLAAGKGGFRLKWPEGGKHVETDLSRQVMVLARRGKAKHIFHISSGAPATPTVRGKYAVYRFEPGFNNKRMYYSVYFHRGYATHGFKPVPTYPASHGCLRNPIPNSIFIYNWLDYGDVFYIYG